MFARQMGKNETSAHLESCLLNRYSRSGGTAKTASTYQQPGTSGLITPSCHLAI
jgi:hypothetical protein